MLVDSGAGLVTTSKCLVITKYVGVGFTYHDDIVHTTNGDITSIRFNGKELQDQSKFTHLSSGLGKISKICAHSQKADSL